MEIVDCMRASELYVVKDRGVPTQIGGESECVRIVQTIASAVRDSISSQANKGCSSLSRCLDTSDERLYR
jgi:hypothetical protein